MTVTEHGPFRLVEAETNSVVILGDFVIARTATKEEAESEINSPNLTTVLTLILTTLDRLKLLPDEVKVEKTEEKKE